MNRSAIRSIPILLSVGFVALVTSCAAIRNTGQAQTGTWAFEPPADSFRADALLDLRSLNEKTAGESGFLQKTPDGDFALGNGKSVRFWAVNEYVQNLEGTDPVAHKARWLAKRGVNMVRVHTGLAPKEEGSKVTDVDQKEVENVWKLVAAMKKEGIYTTISPYWAIPVKLRKSWDVPGGPDQSAAGLLFWDSTLQKGYRAWLKALFAPANRFTGVPLAQDPAVGIIQIQNEDSMLFWTIQGVKGEQLRQLSTKFGGWLKAKYGSLGAANTAWGGEHPGSGDFQDNQGDDFAGGRAGIYIAWHWTQTRAGYQGKRLADQLAFFTDTMRRFNVETADYLRKELGCKQLINAGNWRPADAFRLFDAERYSYAGNDIMAVNRYFTGAHEGKDNGWAIRPGDKFTNVSALLDPRALPVNVKQVAGYPFLIPEMEWVAPNGYQSEGPFLTAAYESLTGVDISYFFADGDVPEWQPPFIPLPWNPPTGKWAIATPMQLGQFPAAALLFREGYLQRGKPVVHEERSLEDLWYRRSPLVAEEAGYDPNRDSGGLPERSAVKTTVDPLAFLVGPVEVKYGGDPAKSTAVDLKPYVDAENKRVKSITGEIRLNYGLGVCVMDAPKAQGATGFLSKVSPLALSAVTIKSGNEYASVSVVSLDGLPIRTSKKVLVQVGTRARPTGWEDKEASWKSGNATVDGKEVVSTGKNPWQIVNTDVTIVVKNALLRKATLLNANGEAVEAIQASVQAGSLTLKLPANAMYVVLQ